MTEQPWALLRFNPSRKELLALPRQAWSASCSYDELVVLPATGVDGRGWSYMTLIGLLQTLGNPKEHGYLAHIIGTTADLQWCIPTEHPKLRHYNNRLEPANLLRSDMMKRASAVHFWLSDLPGWKSQFLVPSVLSSTRIAVMWERTDG